MAKVKSHRDQSRLGPLEEGIVNNVDKHITIVPLLDELDAAEKRALRLKKWDFNIMILRIKSHTF